jgi:hypothetical protein
MDAHFINNLNALIQFYIDADINDDLEKMFKAVKNLEIIISPKIKDTTKEHDNITWIRDNMANIFVFDNATGKVRGVNQVNMLAVRRLLDETYRSLLMKLEKEKIYTAETSDPNKAMGYFGGG